MLGKLIKYELKATGRLFLPIFLSILVLAVINKLLSFLSPLDWSVPASISMAIYVILIIGMFVMSIIVMIQRFYRNLLSDEGYLMFTLPTKPWTHIISKLLVSMFWIAASVTVAFISGMIIVYDKGMFPVIIRGFSEGYYWLYKQLGSSLFLLTLEGLILIITSLISGIMVIYAAIALGHLFNKHKMLASFGAFILLNTLAQFLISLITLLPGSLLYSHLHISANNVESMRAVGQLALMYGIIFTGLLSAIYFSITNYILSKRLNLE